MKDREASDRAPRAWPRFMTARVAADYADTSPWTIRRHVRPCGRRGRAFVYALEDVERWMRGQAIAAPAVAEAGATRAQPTPTEASIARIRALARSRGDEPGDDLDGLASRVGS